MSAHVRFHETYFLFEIFYSNEKNTKNYKETDKISILRLVQHSIKKFIFKHVVDYY